MRWVLGLGMAATTAVATTGAQQPQPLAPATLTGLVIDSLRGGALSGAMVMVVDGTSRQGQTDSLGRFRIDSIPPGSHRIAVFHPLLDTLDIALTLPAMMFTPGKTLSVAVATPTGAMLLRQYCPSEHGAPALILGRVVRVNDDQPMGGATVTLTFDGIPLPPRTSTSQPNGRFTLCSPAAVTKGSLRVAHDRTSTSAIAVALVPGGVVLPVLRVATDTGAVGTAVATGRVIGPKGQPLAGAIVTVSGAAARTQTRDDGTFTLPSLPAGTQSLSVNAIGYTSATIAINLTNGTPWSGDIRLTNAVPVLSTVQVSAQRFAQGYAQVGFSERKSRGVGTFMTYDDIQRKHPMTTTDLFTDVPGLYVDRSFNPPIITGGRGRTSLKEASGICVNLFVDGHRVLLPSVDNSAVGDSGASGRFVPLDIDAQVNKEEVVAVEVYQNANTPVQFHIAGESCPVIVVWTRGMIETTAPDQ